MKHEMLVKVTLSEKDADRLHKMQMNTYLHDGRPHSILRNESDKKLNQSQLCMKCMSK